MKYKIIALTHNNYTNDDIKKLAKGELNKAVKEFIASAWGENPASPAQKKLFRENANKDNFLELYFHLKTNSIHERALGALIINATTEQLDWINNQNNTNSNLKEKPKTNSTDEISSFAEIQIDKNGYCLESEIKHNFGDDAIQELEKLGYIRTQLKPSSWNEHVDGGGARVIIKSAKEKNTSEIKVKIGNNTHSFNLSQFTAEYPKGPSGNQCNLISNENIKIALGEHGIELSATSRLQFVKTNNQWQLVSIYTPTAIEINDGQNIPIGHFSYKHEDNSIKYFDSSSLKDKIIYL